MAQLPAARYDVFQQATDVHAEVERNAHAPALRPRRTNRGGRLTAVGARRT
jgi:hypothetical protein